MAFLELLAFALPLALRTAGHAVPCQSTHVSSKLFGCNSTVAANDTVWFVIPSENISEAGPLFTYHLSVHAPSLQAADAPLLFATASVGRSLSVFQASHSGLHGTLICHMPKKVAVVIKAELPFIDRRVPIQIGVQPNEPMVNFSEPAVNLSVWSRQPSLAAFKVTDAMVVSGEAVFRIENISTVSGTVRAFIFPAKQGGKCFELFRSNNSQCMSGKQLGRCLESREAVTEKGSVASLRSISLTVTQKGSVTVSQWSAVSLEVGLWVVLLKPDLNFGVNSTMYNVTLGAAPWRRPLWLSTLAMFALPVGAVLLLAAANHGLQVLWRFWANHPVPANELRVPLEAHEGRTGSNFFVFLTQKLEGAVRKDSYFALVLVGAAGLFIAALQMAMGLWGLGQAAGDWDMCYYNFECYVPYFLDLPFNNILSHIPYVASGLMVIGLVLRSEHTMLLQSRQRGLLPADLRVFYALGLAVILEAVGSTCYHICPRSFEFQFDTAMMFIIAMLSTIALLDVDAEEGSPDAIPPKALMLLVAIPMWLTSSVGTWLDFLVQKRAGIASRVLYVALVLGWGALVLTQLWRVFPGYPGRCPRGLTVVRASLGLVLLLALVDQTCVPDGNIVSGIGGTSNVLLGLSMFTMAVSSSRQILRHDTPYSRGFARCSWQVSFVKFALLFVFFVVSSVALSFFLEKTNDVLEHPAQSRLKNKNCILMGTFDHHDVWHMTSAVALALWILNLLDIRLRIWRRMLPRRPEVGEGDGLRVVTDLGPCREALSPAPLLTPSEVEATRAESC